MSLWSSQVLNREPRRASPRFPTIVRRAKHGGVALQNPRPPAARQRRAPPPPLPALHFPRTPATTSARRRPAAPRFSALTASRNVSQSIFQVKPPPPPHSNQICFLAQEQGRRRAHGRSSSSSPPAPSPSASAHGSSSGGRRRSHRAHALPP